MPPVSSVGPSLGCRPSSQELPETWPRGCPQLSREGDRWDEGPAELLAEHSSCATLVPRMRMASVPSRPTGSIFTGSLSFGNPQRQACSSREAATRHVLYERALDGGTLIPSLPEPGAPAGSLCFAIRPRSYFREEEGRVFFPPRSVVLG